MKARLLRCSNGSIRNTHTDGHDIPGHIDELALGEAAVVDRHRRAARPISGAAISHAALAACLAQGCAPSPRVLTLSMQVSDAVHGSALGRVWPEDRTMDNPK